ncbi:MAG: DNA helicase RecQ [Eubacterium sp.]|nr:DNA helicase RecQ [Eubacterium sp.]
MDDKYRILGKYFGYSDFREGQEALIDSMLSGRDVLGIMPTGAGKSICYQVPALLLSGITLVVSPLISLMKDQVQALNQAGVHAAYINSSLSESQISKALRLAAAGQYKIIYVAPERLETYEFLQFARQAEIAMLTVDEAHCISQWGQDFRPSYLKIVQFIRGLYRRPVISAFTATATEKVKEDIACVLGLCDPYVLVTGFDRKNLFFAVETTRQKDGYVMQYVQEHKQESGIIYCATRKNVDSVCEKLCAQGIAAAKYHAGLSGDERRRSQEDFIYDVRPVMVATNAFGMGIDKSNVRYVIHYNMPQSLENYYQEAGRAGRDGERAECILLYSAQDVAVNRFLIESKEPNPDSTWDEIEQIRERDEERLRTMNYYCMTTGCLREYILRYFGEMGTGRCENCQNCAREYEETDVTQAAMKIIACILESRQRYGINVTAGILAGDGRAKLREYGVFEYASYGSLKELREMEIKEIINQMLVEGLLAATKDKYALLKVQQAAGDVVDGRRRVLLKKVKEDHRKAETGRASASAKMRRSDILNSKGLELFERLRALRTEIAKEEGLPPYIIFSDKTLVDLCVKAPFDKSEMMQVNGVGEHKYNRYGQRFLAAVLDYTKGAREKYYFGDAPQAAAQGASGQEMKAPCKKKADFSLTKEQAAAFPYAEKYLVAELAEKLNGLRDADTTKKISGAEIFRRMQALEYAGEAVQDGIRRKYVTEKGRAAGLLIGMRRSKKGTEYEDIYYKEEAQRMVVAMVIA